MRQSMTELKTFSMLKAIQLSITLNNDSVNITIVKTKSKVPGGWIFIVKKYIEVNCNFRFPKS